MNKFLRFFFIIVLPLFSAAMAAAQDYPVLHYTNEEGLPSNIVYSVYRDEKGYIWFATDKGVARYNGIKFEIFSTFNGLPDNEIFFLQADNYGRLWLGTFNGELCYYKDGVFHTSANTPFLKLPFIESHTRHISNEYDSSIIISYNNPAKFLVIHNEASRIFDLGQLHDPAIVSSFIFGKKVSENRYKLICRDKDVFIDTLYHILEVDKIDSRFINQGTFTSCQNQDYLYNDGYIFTMDRQLVKTVENNLLKPNFLHELYIEQEKVYYATSGGLFINDNPRALIDADVSAITQDNQRNYWISTLNSGVYMLKKDYLGTKYYKDVYKGVAKYATAYNNILFFATADNDLFELRNDKVSCVFNYGVINRESYDYPVTFGFLIDSNYRYYNVYHSDYTVIDNLLTPKIKTQRDRSYEGTKDIFTSAGNIYLKLPHNLVRFEDQGDPARNDPKSLQIIGMNAGDERIFGTAKAPDNSIWYSTVKNMFKVDNGMEDGIPQLQFRHISLKYFDFFGKYLIGYTHTNQLLICSNYTGGAITVDSISQRNCIWDKMYKIDSTHILISTNNLYRLLTINAGTATEIFPLQSIEDPFLPLHAEAICTDGCSWFFLKNGSVTVIDPKSLLSKPEPPELFFTNIKTVSGIYPIGKEIQLPFSEANNMTLSFSPLSFGGRNVQCQYSVSKNEQDNWRDVSGEEINLINPGFGDYTIKLKAKTQSSHYSEPIEFTLHILRPYWYSWWFVTLTCVVLTLILGGAIRYRIMYVVRKKEKEHDTEIKFMKSEYKALNALMNPHFIFNTLNNVQGLINRNDKLGANEYIRVFADLIRQNMQNISKELISLQKEISLVTNYLVLEKLRFKEHLNYHIEIEEGIDLSEIMIPPLLVQPLVENSIKHGILPLESGDGFIGINIYERNNALHIEVKDNGIGMQRSKNEKDPMYESFGLENVRKRISQLSIMQDKQIRFSISETRDDGGRLAWTIVTISIPQTLNPSR